MRFELTIPDEKGESRIHTLNIEAPNWLAALQRALVDIGAEQIPKGKAVCDVRDDGVIIVRNSITGREFFIRTLPDAHAESQSPPPPTPDHHQPARTVTYLETELEQLNNTKSAAAKLLERRKPPGPQPPLNAVADHFQDNAGIRTQEHPCVVIPRSEVLRRLAEHQALARDKAVPGTSSDNGLDHGVRFMWVVEVPLEKRNDTLASLKVDLDALRRASDLAKVGDSEGTTPPKGFEWIRDPLETLLSGTGSRQEAADRVLRLSLAAVPSRLAVYFEKCPDAPALKAIAAVGRKLEGTLLTKLDLIVPPFSLLDQCGGSVVLEQHSSKFPTSLLVPPLDSAPKNALLTAVGSKTGIAGAILLAESLSGETYTPSHLAVATYIAARIRDRLGA